MISFGKAEGMSDLSEHEKKAIKESYMEIREAVVMEICEWLRSENARQPLNKGEWSGKYNSEWGDNLMVGRLWADEIERRFLK